MCEQCSAEVDEYGRPLPGWMFCQATKDGSFMKKGDWGLVQSNDPSFIWAQTPVKDPTFGKTDAELNEDKAWEGYDDFTEVASKFDEELVSDPYDGWKLYDACLKAGYDRKVHGRLSYWLFDFLARWLEKNPIPTYQNRFNDLRDAGDRL